MWCVACWDLPQHCLPGLYYSHQLISDTKQLVTSTVTGARDVLTSTVAGAKDAVSSRVTGVMDMTKGAVQGSVQLTKSAVSSGVTTVMGSTVGQMVASGVGSMLEKSEELVDHYLPMTDEELGKGLMAVCGVGGESQCGESPGGAALALCGGQWWGGGPADGFLSPSQACHGRGGL